MKKSIMLTLLSCLSLPLWAGDLPDAVLKLRAEMQEVQARLEVMMNQINAIPEGKQGRPGEKGEKGSPGSEGKPGRDGLSCQYTAGNGIEIRDGTISTKENRLQIGDIHHGGIIFWLDETGRHGLVASKMDLNQGRGIQWQNGESGAKVTNARGNGIGAGESNTRLIIAQQTVDNQQGNFAALIAASFSVQADGETPCGIEGADCYGEWYLPSAYELKLMRDGLYQQGIGIFSSGYWSSTEKNTSLAFMLDFSTGEMKGEEKSRLTGQIRAVSRF